MWRGELATALALLLVLAAAPARGAIEGSPHDLVGQGYAAARTGTPQDRCTPCHVDSLDPKDPGGFPGVPRSLLGRYGAATLACFSCHDGITLVAPEVDASLTAFHPAGHGGAPAGLTAAQAEGGGGTAEGTGGECASCHNPHESRHRPFLRAPLATLCVGCHAIFNRDPAAQRDTTGSHPVGIDPIKALRQEAPNYVAPALRNPFPAAYPLQMGRGSTGTHWDLGGHLAGGGVGEIVCVTCHAVHGDEETPPKPALLAIDPVNEVANLLCEGCHRGQRGDGLVSTAAPNPGGTVAGRTYHPCDDDLANGPGRITEIRVPPGWPFGAGDPPRLLCSTCHASHRAEPGTSLLRPAASAANFCGECHDRAPSQTHHPSGVSSGPCSSRLPTAAAGLPARITCELCHRAHNAGLGSGREAEFVPLLRAELRGDDLCVTCHPAGNPACSVDATHAASHFLGNPTLPETYGDPAPPLRTQPWPESGLSSRFGGESGTTIICLSCHSFKPGALVSGDDGTARHLLARVGNGIEWGPGEEGLYLCTGCHGANPGKGNEGKGHHPLMEADVAKLGVKPVPPLTNTPSGRVNCDSCHRSHNAHTASGVYMLERVAGVNTVPTAIKPPIDFTPTCHGCHDPGKY